MVQSNTATSESVGAIITLIMGVGIAVLLLIFIGVLSGQTYNLTEDQINDIGGTVTLEGITGVLNTASSLRYDQLINSSIVITNNTDTFNLHGNFTVNLVDGTITPINARVVGPVNVSYDHGSKEMKSSVINSIRSGFSAIEQTGDYLPIIVLAVIITLILALILSMGIGMGGVGGGKSNAL